MVSMDMRLRSRAGHAGPNWSSAAVATNFHAVRGSLGQFKGRIEEGESWSRHDPTVRSSQGSAPGWPECNWDIPNKHMYRYPPEFRAKAVALLCHLFRWNKEDAERWFNWREQLLQSRDNPAGVIDHDLHRDVGWFVVFDTVRKGHLPPQDPTEWQPPALLEGDALIGIAQPRHLSSLLLLDPDDPQWQAIRHRFDQQLHRIGLSLEELSWIRKEQCGADG